MLTISLKQYENLEVLARSDFETRVLHHVRECFPDQMAFVGTEWQQRLFVRDAIRTAWQHGFELEQDIVRYVGLVALLGQDFDLTPQWRSLAAVLRTKEVVASERLDKAYELATAPAPGQNTAISY